MTLLNKIGIVSDEKLENFKKSIEAQKAAVEVAQELTDREIKLTERRRKFLVDEAKQEMEISELKAKAADKDKYTDEENKRMQSFRKSFVIRGIRILLNVSIWQLLRANQNSLKER